MVLLPLMASIATQALISFPKFRRCAIIPIPSLKLPHRTITQLITLYAGPIFGEYHYGSRVIFMIDDL